MNVVFPKILHEKTLLKRIGSPLLLSLSSALEEGKRRGGEGGEGEGGRKEKRRMRMICFGKGRKERRRGMTGRGGGRRGKGRGIGIGIGKEIDGTKNKRMSKMYKSCSSINSLFFIDFLFFF